MLYVKSVLSGQPVGIIDQKMEDMLLLSHIKNKAIYYGYKKPNIWLRSNQTKANSVGLSVMCPSMFTALIKTS